jgi:hypothetical protein
MCAPERFGGTGRAKGKRVPSIFRAGDKVPTTGLYKVVHGREHVEAHYVTALQGDVFPACLECSDNVRFEMALSAARVNAHPLFKR